MGWPEITMRMAKNEDGPRIAELCEKGCGFGGFEEWNIDWGQIAPWWIVAEHEGQIVGAIQFCPSRPVARLEMLSIDPGADIRVRGVVADLLTRQGTAQAHLAGCSAVSAVIEEGAESFKKVAERRGWFVGARGDLMYKRCN